MNRTYSKRKPSKLKPLTLIASMLLSVVAIAFFSLYSLAAQNAGTKIEFVSPSWVSANANNPDLRILDVRWSPIDYFTGHLPNAVHIADNLVRQPKDGLPVQLVDSDKLAGYLSKAGVTDKSKVLIYSDGRDVLGASQIAYALERIGFKNSVAVLDGGLSGYKQANAELTQAFPKYKTGKLSVSDNKNIRVNLSQVKDLLGKQGVVFIDPRPPKAFAGEEKYFVRNGHIPGARNIPWPSFTDPQNPHKLKPLSEIEKILADKKIDKSKDIIVTCTTGREASLQYVVLKHLLGYPKVRIYEGSWTEYSQSDLPVETGAERPA
ncbi:MAG: sulfurtransferase [Pseudanabaena frigida]|uniref:Sulfurtransferase n=1 Tax=Pseudanabaena frigida TaxID=945775 RepID=A0A2W4XLE5_9CYAN|nr:MAG: sulfurtransferase [Pseudanabaena frigida]